MRRAGASRGEIKRLVVENLSRKTDDQIREQIESKTRTHLEWIRVNGSLFGALFGLCAAFFRSSIPLELYATIVRGFTRSDNARAPLRSALFSGSRRSRHNIRPPPIAPPPLPPFIGPAALAARAEANTDNSRAMFSPWQAGHSVSCPPGRTKLSNERSQSAQ